MPRGPCGLAVVEWDAVFITDHALIIVRKDTGPRSCCQSALGFAGGKDVTGLGGAPAGGCHVHGGLGGAFGRAGGNHQQLNRFLCRLW